MEKLVIVILLTASTFVKCVAQNNISFVMSRLWCDQTTEAGEDEIYLKVIAKMSNGAYLNSQQPGDHWSINDGKNPRNIDEITLLRTRLNRGEYGTIIIAVCEQDGGGIWTMATSRRSRSFGL